MSRVPFTEKEVAQFTTFHPGANGIGQAPKIGAWEQMPPIGEGDHGPRTAVAQIVHFLRHRDVERIGVVRRSVPAAAVLRPKEDPA